MSRIFHRHGKNKGASDVLLQVKERKCAVVRLLEFRCRGKLLYSAKSDTLGERVRIGRAEIVTGVPEAELLAAIGADQ